MYEINVTYKKVGTVPLLCGLHVEHPLHDGGHLQPPQQEGVGLRLLRRHNLKA